MVGASILGLSGILFGYKSWERLRPYVSVTPFSFPGFDGRARLPAYTPSPEDYADDLAEHIEAFELDPIRILAHCSGCTVGLALAVKYPHLVKDLTLVAYWHGTKEWESRKDGVEDLRAYMLKRAPRLVADDGLHEDLVSYGKSAITDVEGMLQMARNLSTFSAKPYLSQVKVPTRFVVGLKDKVTSPDAQQNIAKTYGFPCLTMDAGHCPHIEQPAVFAQLY